MTHSVLHKIHDTILGAMTNNVVASLKFGQYIMSKIIVLFLDMPSISSPHNKLFHIL